MKSLNYKICKRCVMDTTDPLIIFDESGYCNHCKEFLNIRINHKYNGTTSDEKLKNIIRKIKYSGKNNDYDCLIGVSGGVDSSYVTLKAKELGLRPLLVHLDNGWNREEAIMNIKKITNQLKIDYETFILNWEEFKDLQLAFLKASVPEAETPTDMAIPGSLHKIAAKYNIKYIISGGNFATEGILPKIWQYNARDLKYLKFISQKFGKKQLKNFPTFGYLKEFYFKIFKGINMFYMLNYFSYSKNSAIKELEKKLDWKYYGGKHYESRYTSFIQSFYMFKKFNIDYRRATFSTEICCGDMERKEALKLLKTLPYNENNLEKNISYICKKLTITREEFDEILSKPGRWYLDYPNDEKKLNFIYNTYRKIFKKEKLANF